MFGACYANAWFRGKCCAGSTAQHLSCALLYSSTAHEPHSLTLRVVGLAGTTTLGAHRAQVPGVELQAKVRTRLEASSPTTTAGAFPRTLNVADERNVSSAGKGGGANLVLRGPTSVLTAATGSLVTSRVPAVKVASITWDTPATEMTARGFRWPDGVNNTWYTIWATKRLQQLLRIVGGTLLRRLF